MKFSQYLAVAGILSIFGYGYAIPLTLAKCTPTPGYVYIARQISNNLLTYEFENPCFIAGASGGHFDDKKEAVLGKFDDKKGKVHSSFRVLEVAKFPVDDCLNAFINAAAYFEAWCTLRITKLSKNQLLCPMSPEPFQKMVDDIQTALIPRLKLDIPPTSSIVPCANSRGYVNALFTSFTEDRINGDHRSFICVWIFESLNNLPDPGSLLEGITLPRVEISPDSDFRAFPVENCSAAVDKANLAIYKEYPRTYWYAGMSTFYGQPCILTYEEETFDHFTRVVANAIAKNRLE